MDLATLVGLLVGIGGLIVGFALEGGSINKLMILSPAVTVLGGTIGAVMISSSMNDIKKLPSLFKKAFTVKKSGTKDTIESIIKLATIARKEGLLHLEEALTEGEFADKIDPMMKNGIMLAIDGNSAELIQEVLHTKIFLVEHERKNEIAMFEAAGGFSPTMGIIGTVMGLVLVLGNLSNPEELASSIAAAFVATLYGVFLANIIFLPVASKLKLRLKEEKLEKQILIQGVLSISAGENPFIIRGKLESFLHDEHKKDKDKEEPKEDSKE